MIGCTHHCLLPTNYLLATTLNLSQYYYQRLQQPDIGDIAMVCFELATTKEVYHYFVRGTAIFTNTMTHVFGHFGFERTLHQRLDQLFQQVFGFSIAGQ